jgi:hypothetical protein
MDKISNISTIPFSTLVPVLERKKPSLNQIIYNIASAIIFPLGLYRCSAHFIAKKFFSCFIVGSTSRSIKISQKHEEAIKSVHLEMRNGLKFEELIGVDGIKILQERSTDEWIVYTLPSCGIWQKLLEDTLIPIAQNSGRNLLCVNYPGAGKNRGKPNSFNHLLNNVEKGLKKIDATPENTVFMGHSLGCASALRLADKYEGTNVVIQNTFSKLDLLAKPYREILKKTLERAQKNQTRLEKDGEVFDRNTKQYVKKPLKIVQRLNLAAKDAFLSIPQLLENLFRLQFKTALLDAKEIGKTILIETALTILGIASVPISLVSNKINRIKGKLKSFYTSRSAVLTFVNSNKFLTLAKQILKTAGWEIDNYQVFEKLVKRGVSPFVVQVEKDDTIPENARLSKKILESYPNYLIHKNFSDLNNELKDHHDHIAKPCNDHTCGNDPHCSIKRVISTKL